MFWTAQNLSKRYPPPFRWIERYCLNRCSGWLACGQSIVEAMSGRGFAAKPHRIMPLGVDLDRFRIDPEGRDRVRNGAGVVRARPSGGRLHGPVRAREGGRPADARPGSGRVALAAPCSSAAARWPRRSAPGRPGTRAGSP